MANALLTGVSGLIAHQRMLDVVGNNLANINTTGFKSQRVLFADLLYENIKPATGGVAGASGGTNPSQVGSGVKVGQIDRNFSQGSSELTGQELDFEIKGDGFFMLDKNGINVFTRAGAFKLDSNGTLVDPSTGSNVQRIGNVGEPAGSNLGFQTPGDTSINIPIGATIPGQATTRVELLGNLSTDSALAPAAEEQLTTQPFLDGGGSPATAATLLNDLQSNTADYLAGEAIRVTAVDSAGTDVSFTFTLTTGSETLGNLQAAIDAAISDATVSLDAAGRMSATANATGPSQLDITLTDVAGNTGATNFDQHVFEQIVAGRDGGKVQQSVEVFDTQGSGHMLSLEFERTSGNTWDMIASMDPAEGTLGDNEIRQFRFNNAGVLQTVLGGGANGDANIEIDFQGLIGTQTIDFGFGDPTTFNALTSQGGNSALSPQQDGFRPGELVSVEIESATGILKGRATNGQTFDLAQLAIASFSNVGGLTGIGDNYFEESLNSGAPQLGSAGSGGRGSVASGSLEGANVEIALEFTRLIVAQRGFSANARTITVADEVLEELTNIIR